VRDLVPAPPTVGERPGTANAELPKWQLLTRMEPHRKVIRRWDGTVSVAAHTEPLTVLHGPHLRLNEGFYQLRVQCEVGSPRRPLHPVVGVEIIAQNRFHRGWSDFTADELRMGHGTLEFEVPPGVAADHGNDAPFEFRIMHLRNAGLTVRAIELRQIPGWEMPRSYLQWRLLGRLYPIWRRWARSSSVHIGRMTTTGLLLGRCFPHLHLPAGSYRLDLRCLVSSVDNASRPVLRIEVLTQHRLSIASHDFFAAELTGGHGSIDLVVSEEFAVENGEHIRFEVRLSHFHNASLSINAIDLRMVSEQFGAPTTALTAPRAPMRMPRRTNVLIIGNCQAGLVAESFRKNAFLASRFRTRHHWMELPANQHEQGKRELSECDILLIQDIREWPDYPLRSYVPEKVPIIRFPCLRFASLWPFDAFNGPDDRQARQHDYPNFEFTYFDGLLGRLRRQIPDKNLRFEVYHTLNLPDLIDYRRIHRLEERRLAAMDKAFGGSIGAFILENFRARQVLYTTAHPSGEILAMLLRQIAAELDIKRRLGRLSSLHELDRLQVPVHPMVATTLGVKWADESTKYLYRGEYITWETYIRRYIDYYG
jgi:hypothetical protein